MPAKNTLKSYVDGGYYHIYNRGVEKREIFLDELDYDVFMGYLKEYLSPKNEIELFSLSQNRGTSFKVKNDAFKKLKLKNFNSDIQLLAYCLMPNHFHFFIKQKSHDSIDRFMSSLCTRYTMYFNRRHDRVGKLYQGVYKAALMINEAQYLHITRYIHKQALVKTDDGQRDFPSSFPEYLGLRITAWIHPEEILSFFSKSSPALSYKTFVDEYDPPSEGSNLEI
jgi:putative transposase